MTEYQTQLSSFEDADHSLGLKRTQLQSRAQLSAEAFMSNQASGNFITRFSRKLLNASHIFTGILFALFIIVLLIAIVIGTNVYKSLYGSQQALANERIATSLLYNTIRTVDSIDALEIAAGPEGPALILNEYAIAGTYETRLYLYDGALVQEYAHDGAPFDPSQATRLIETEAFDFNYRDGLLTIMTSQGQTNIALRCAMGGE